MDALHAAYTALSRHVQLPEIDVLIQRAEAEQFLSSDYQGEPIEQVYSP